MRAILRKDKCLTAIGERSAKVMNDNKGDEMDVNAIVNHHLALVDGVLSSIEEKKCANEILDYLARLFKEKSLHNKIFLYDDVASTILEEENRCNNREDIQTSSRQVKALVVTSGRPTEDDPSRSHEKFKSGKKKGATFHMSARSEWFYQYKSISKGRSVYSSNDHELMIIRIGSIMVKMHDGAISTIGDVRHMEGLKKNLFSLGRCWVYPIKKKYDVFEVFKVYKARVELDSRKKIKCLRTDNRGEYIDEGQDQPKEEEVEPRRSKRARTEKSFGPDSVSFIVENEPTSYREAVTSLEWLNGKKPLKVK
nr:Gag-Pol polyprotein [Tanacetum cinerariifolium]